MKKNFEKPTLVIVVFTDDDIITASGDLVGQPGMWQDEPDPDDQSAFKIFDSLKSNGGLVKKH